jgi:C4-dicarboxylate transporter, DctQ subunit
MGHVRLLHAFFVWFFGGTPAAMNTTPDWEARPLSLADRVLAKCEDSFNWIAGITIFLLMVTGVIQIVGRKVFNLPLYGYIDVVELSAAIYAFFGVAYCQRLGGHVRMEMFLSRLRRRALWTTEGGLTVVALVVIGLLTMTSWDHFMRAYELGDSTIDAEIPIWPAKLAIPIALALLWLRLVVQLIGFLRLSVKPDSEPIAVPLMHDVREKAEEQIRETLV